LKKRRKKTQYWRSGTYSFKGKDLYERAMPKCGWNRKEGKEHEEVSLTIALT